MFVKGSEHPESITIKVSVACAIVVSFFWRAASDDTQFEADN